MKTFHLPLLALILLFGATTSFSQTTDEVSPCGANQAMDEYIELHPEAKDQIEESEAELEAFTQSYIQSKATEDTLWIPVVFHIIHLNGPENISSDILKESIERLNLDYMALYSDLDQIDPAFQDLVPETFIQFRLATIDPDGNCTSGITRTYSSTTDASSFPSDQPVHWPRNKYLNIWVVRDILSGAAAYSRYPSSVASAPLEDGIVNRYDYLGYNRGTLTHEVGHWINLAHIWGNSNTPSLEANCSEDDGVADTPLCIGNNGCNLSFESCGSHDNTQNHMNYSSCRLMFTQGQSDRMRAALNSSISQRNNLWTPANMASTGIDVEPILCSADFVVQKNLFCIGEEVAFFDNSFNGEVTSWEWSFDGGIPATSNEKNPVITFTEGGLHTISLTVSDGVNSFTTVKDDFIRILPVGAAAPYNEMFEEATLIPNDDWFVESANSTNWEITTDAAAVGTKSVYLRNRIQSDDEKDDLISSTVDLSGVADAELSFKFAFAKKTDGDSDKLRVRISRNCGETWVVKKTLKANTGSLVTAPNQFSEFTPEADQWGEVSIGLSSLYYIDNFRFKFEFINGGGNNVYIDDIKVYDPTITGINEVNQAVLNYQVYPNPVTNELNIEFNLLENTNIRGEIFDISGRKVKTLFSSDYSLGTHRLNFDASDLIAGLYFVKITLKGESFVERVIKN